MGIRTFARVVLVELADPYGHRREVERLRQAARDLDAAMHSVWLHGKWRWLTTQMTTAEKEAAADAVDRHNATYPPDDRGEPVDRWWRDGRPTGGDTRGWTVDRYDALRLHLRLTHCNEAAGNLIDAEALDQHWHEHHRPGGLRNHDQPAQLHDWPAAAGAGSDA